MIHTIPTDQIDAAALPRDRTTHDDEAFTELCNSIAAEGLRQPIEVFANADPEAARPYCLISGFRRLAAIRHMGIPTVQAFLRTPETLDKAMAAMVSENEIRAQISPWEKAALITACLEEELHPNADTAIQALFHTTSRQKTSRIRGHVGVVQAFGNRFATPERLSTARLDRLAAAVRTGWTELLLQALPASRDTSLESQWQAIAPLLDEALNPRDPAPMEPGAPRRSRTIRTGLTVRRELTRTGWILRFTGPGAKSPGIIDDVMDYVEHWFGRKE